MTLEATHDLDHEAIHLWFELTYASYLTIPRSILQSMPDEWQRQFVLLLEQCRERVLAAGIEEPHYTVHARDSHGQFIEDPLRAYDRGRRRVFR
jgi:hypothetical protein